MPNNDPIDFALNTQFEDLPEQVISNAVRGLTDTLGVAVAASRTELSRIIKDHVLEHFAAGTGAGALLWQDGRRVSPAGAALANGMTTDALDAHDGSKPTKGHVGCGVVAAALATTEGCSGPELLTRIAIGYEIGTRAGIALHASAKDYHTSGAWVALACAAITARALGLNAGQTRDAVGIAEYHGPRSPMMRCIDHPTMVKDGSGWGAMAGVSAGYLARDGFTGAPAETLQGPVWADLGERWYIHEQYIKLYPVCRWAQPAVEAVLQLVRDYKLSYQQVAAVEVETFHEATRLSALPETTEQAQYSLPFSVAAALCRGTIGVAEVSADGFGDPEIVALARKVTAVQRAEFDAAFPARRFAVVHVTLADGRVFASEVTEARGDPEAPVSAEGIAEKFDGLAGPVLGLTAARGLREAVAALAEGGSVEAVMTGMARPLVSAG
ncbi:MmgE/PrpD family protein [Pacificoceanicola onchidii]|uniref:MmgE/PrpD family protein n=1 Tax=Pacificoceanicola onchidii TaxID=2562685 RepID=UPI0010A36DFA|nr:MmgE/PrpD family protein [Pacificoceanicola onchidii]